MNEAPIGSIEPIDWVVVFHPDTAIPFVRVACPGRFKHVSAWGYYPGFKSWLIFDPQWAGLRLSMVSHADMPTAFPEYSRGCAVLRTPRLGEIGLSPMSRLGFWCVPAIKHLLGVRCAIWRPDALYRHILRRGGIPIGKQDPTTCARPEPAG